MSACMCITYRESNQDYLNVKRGTILERTSACVCGRERERDSSFFIDNHNSYIWVESWRITKYKKTKEKQKKKNRENRCERSSLPLST